MTAPRARTLTVLACTAGAALALFAASRAWTTLVEARPAPLAPLRTTRTGAALHPWLPALCLVALAGAGALLATRGVLRLAVGVLLVGCGAGIAATARPGGWALLCALGGVLVAAAGVVAVARGRRWPTMGARYDRPATGPAQSGTHIWDALDRGDDPTA